MLVYQRVSLYSVYSLSIAPTNPPAKVGHSTTQSPPLIAAWWFQLVDVGRSPRVWCLKSTRFWYPLPTSRISGLAVDLSFSCHPRHRSCGRPVVSSQKMIKMVTWSGIPWKKVIRVIRSNWTHAVLGGKPLIAFRIFTMTNNLDVGFANSIF